MTHISALMRVKATFGPPSKTFESGGNLFLVNIRTSRSPRCGLSTRSLQASATFKGQLNSLGRELAVGDPKSLGLKKAVNTDNEVLDSHPTTWHSPAGIKSAATEDGLEESTSVAGM
ncbi:MAG: hypothetical protein OXI33_15475 [Chloroflexota bacterium]|nr:hypothetical protein [Chloroflexota bacterium]